MPPKTKTATAAPPTCGYTVSGTELCGATATHVLPAGSAASSDPLLLCGQHAARFLGAAVAL
jgi:hypothetical protein